MLRPLPAALLFAGILLAPPAARAQEAGGWFTTFQVGQADYDLVLRDGGPWWGRVDDDGDAVALGVGYNWLPQLAFRFMFERDGSIAARNICPPGEICPAVVFRESTRADVWSLVAMPRLRFGGWEAYATAGAMHWSIRPRGTIPRDNDTDFIYGGGIGWRFENGLGIAAEYQEAGSDYDALRLNASFEF
jgi:hypothetical protein